MKRYNRRIGAAAITLGTSLILVLVLPSDFWFFAVGVLLIACGVFACRRR